METAQTYTGPIHLRPIEQETVDAFCQRVASAANCNFSILMEMRGFKKDRTPWDAQRLANVLAIYDIDPELVRDLDRLAEERAGLVPLQRDKP